MSVNSFDTQILLVENQGMYKAIQESVIRLYDVGRRRDDEDEQVHLMFGLLCDKLFNVFFFCNKDQEEDDEDDDLDNDNSDDDRSDGARKLLIFSYYLCYFCFLTLINSGRVIINLGGDNENNDNANSSSSSNSDSDDSSWTSIFSSGSGSSFGDFLLEY